MTHSGKKEKQRIKKPYLIPSRSRHITRESDAVRPARQKKGRGSLTEVKEKENLAGRKRIIYLKARKEKKGTVSSAWRIKKAGGRDTAVKGQGDVIRCRRKMPPGAPLSINKRGRKAHRSGGGERRKLLRKKFSGIAKSRDVIIAGSKGEYRRPP